MRLSKLATAALLLTLLGASTSYRVWADDTETKVVGPVVKIEVAADGKSAVATLRVKGKMVPVQVTDELTLNKFRIKKIQPGDEIRCIFTTEDGKNLSKTFRRTAGC